MPKVSQLVIGALGFKPSGLVPESILDFAISVFFILFFEVLDITIFCCLFFCFFQTVFPIILVRILF